MSFPFYFKLSAQRTYRTIALVIISVCLPQLLGLNAPPTTAIDIYKRNLKEEKSEKHYLKMTKFFTLFWELAIFFASIVPYSKT
jgi:hypothetical protein